MKFADDTKIISPIQSDVDAANMQRDVDKLLQWSVVWHMQFNVSKCKVMHIGKQKVEHEYSIQLVQLVLFAHLQLDSRID